MTEDTIILLNI